MTEYVLTYTVPPEMPGRAMMSWAKPPRSRRETLREVALAVLACVFAVCVIGVIMVREILSAEALLGAIVGFCTAVAIWTLTHRLSTARIMGFSKQALAREGPLTARFCADCFEISSSLSTGRMRWLCIDDVIALPDASVLRAGGVIYAVPDTALPPTVAPATFRADLDSWQEAAR